MSKVYQISNKISSTTLILVVILLITSCSTYQPSGYESDGVYYNPKTDKTYDDVRNQYYNESKNEPSEIKIGSPYFDAENNGAEQFFYGDVANKSDNTSSQQTQATTVQVNNYGLGGYNYFGNNDYTLSYRNNASSWGRNDGVEVNVWNNYSPWGWNRFYSPWFGGGFGLSMGFGWNNWGYPGYGFGWNNWGYPGYGFGWNNWGYPGYGFGWNNWGYPGYGFGWRSMGTYAQPGNRYGNNFNSSINSNRPVAGRNNQFYNNNSVRPGRNNASINSNRPSVDRGQYNNTRPTREMRPSIDRGQYNNTRPTREMRPSVDRGQYNNTRPTREMRPSVDRGQYNNTRPTREYNSGYNTRPTRDFQPAQRGNYNNTPSSRPSYSSPSRGSMGSGSFGSGSRGGSAGGGIRGGRR